jgi:hypothetical protein
MRAEIRRRTLGLQLAQELREFLRDEENMATRESTVLARDRLLDRLEEYQEDYQED